MCQVVSVVAGHGCVARVDGRSENAGTLGVSACTLGGSACTIGGAASCVGEEEAYGRRCHTAGKWLAVVQLEILRRGIAVIAHQ